MLSFSPRAFIALFILLCVSSAYGHKQVVVIPLGGDDTATYSIGDIGPAGGSQNRALLTSPDRLPHRVQNPLADAMKFLVGKVERGDRVGRRVGHGRVATRAP